MDCLFCAVAAGTQHADMLYADDEVVAFRDIRPQAPSHFLVIPREHIEGPADIDEARACLAGKLIAVAALLARREGLAEDGYRLVLNQGRFGGQSVFHMHLHVLGGRRLGWPPG